MPHSSVLSTSSLLFPFGSDFALTHVVDGHTLRIGLSKEFFSIGVVSFSSSVLVDDFWRMASLSSDLYL